MGSVLSMDRQPADPNAETVEVTAVQSINLPVGHKFAKPIPSVSTQTPVLAPSLQIRTGEGNLLLLASSKAEAKVTTNFHHLATSI